MTEGDVYSKLAEKVQMPNSRWIPMILKKIITPEEEEKWKRLVIDL